MAYMQWKHIPLPPKNIDVIPNFFTYKINTLLTENHNKNIFRLIDIQGVK